MSLIHHVIAHHLRHASAPTATPPSTPPSTRQRQPAARTLRPPRPTRQRRPIAPRAAAPTIETSTETAGKGSGKTRSTSTPSTGSTTSRRATRSGRATTPAPRRRRWLGWLVLTGQLLVLALLVSGSTAHADTLHPAIHTAAGSAVPADTVVLAVAGSVDEVLTNVRNWLMGILASLATVYLTIGGVRRVFASGDPGEQEKAKEAFKAAAIGYCLAALAPLVVTVLKGIVGS